ncbi:tellurite resistance TerB family protein [Silicimonas sp. MF1-12-2]|uniref:tellurite resistance TerB family protein n=1 Tax=Silicimonas sp. MF1-12-2 TaxID=3384793 RepID=UPI0039B4B17F
MSFVKTLATLAVGFAAAKGYDKYKNMGGMDGVRDAMRSNPQITGMSEQAFETMDKMGLPTEQFRGMMDKFMGAGADGGNAAAGIAGLMAAMGGGMAAGAAQTGQMIDAMTGTSIATDTMEENAKLMIRAMIQAAKADGVIDAEEKARIFEYLGDAGPEQRAFVEAEMAAPVDVMSLAGDTSEQMKAQVYATSLMAVRVDKMSEAQYLNALAEALGLSEETRDRIHKSMGVA